MNASQLLHSTVTFPIRIICGAVIQSYAFQKPDRAPIALVCRLESSGNRMDESVLFSCR